MPFQQSGRIRYFVFDSLKQHPITQAIFTRQGGYSSEPWKSLNFGGTVGDDPECVCKNQEIALNALGCKVSSIHDVWQIHSAKVVRIDKPRTREQTHYQADAMITNKPSVNLLMRFADCVPIQLYDPIIGVVGLVHSGWKGTVRNVASTTIKMMQHWYGCLPQNIIAGIGPSIGVQKYEIGLEVEKQVLKTFGVYSDHVLHRENGKVKFDLWEANRLQLVECGVEKIEIAKICTASNLEDWYSHRGERGRTGRFGALIGLIN